MEKEIQHYVISYLLREYAANICIDSEEDLDMHIFSKKWNLPPWALIYLMHDLEKKYGVQFTEEDIDAGKLYTVRKLSETVKCKLAI